MMKGFDDADPVQATLISLLKVLTAATGGNKLSIENLSLAGHRNNPLHGVEQRHDHRHRARRHQ